MTREPEWDDDERTRMRALGAYEDGLCQCGFHRSLTSDRNNFFQIEESLCLVCARSEQYARRQHDQDDQARKALGENAPPGTPLPGDGRLTYIRPMPADEVARQRAERAQQIGGRRGDKA